MPENNRTLKIKSKLSEASGLSGRDLLTTEQLTLKEIELIINLAQKLKAFRDHHFSTHFFKEGFGVGCFYNSNHEHQWPFRLACRLTGLLPEVVALSSGQIKGPDFGFLGGIAGLAEVIAVDEETAFPGKETLTDMLQFLDHVYQMKVIPHRPVLINIRSGTGWPVQALTELLFLKDHFGSLKSMKTKRLTISWIYKPEQEVSKILPVSIIRLLTRFGMHITLAHPPGYELPEEAISNAQKSSATSKGKLKLSNRFKKSMKEADVVYLIPWSEQEELVTEDDVSKLENENLQLSDGLEQEEKSGFIAEKWILTPKRKHLAKEGQAIFLEWPAILQKQDTETFPGFISTQLNEIKRIQLQPFIIASMMLAQRFANPNILLQEMINNDLLSSTEKG